MPNIVIGAIIGAVACGVIGFIVAGEVESISRLEGFFGGAAIGAIIGLFIGAKAK